MNATAKQEQYAILTRFGDYFQVWAHDLEEARAMGECSIALDAMAGTRDGDDSVHQVQLVPCPIQGIRDDLAEIMAK